MKKLLSLIIVLITFVSCDFMDDVPATPIVTACSQSATYVNASQYNQIDTLNYTVTNVVLTGNCLEVTIGSSGCNPNNWDMNFIASEMVVETNPVLYKAKVELINNEDCLSVYQKIVSFDITPLQMSGTDKIQISIEGWSTPIIYQY